MRVNTPSITCINVLSGQQRKGLVLITEHLDKHQVPDLEHIGVILRNTCQNSTRTSVYAREYLIDEMCRLPSSNTVKMQLCAWSAGACKPST